MGPFLGRNINWIVKFWANLNIYWIVYYKAQIFAESLILDVLCKIIIKVFHKIIKKFSWDLKHKIWKLLNSWSKSLLVSDFSSKNAFYSCCFTIKVKIYQNEIPKNFQFDSKQKQPGVSTRFSPFQFNHDIKT